MFKRDLVAPCFASTKTKPIERFMAEYTPWLSFRRRLRRGGEALAIQAWHNELNCAMVLRIADPELAEIARKRFVRSCQLLQQLQSKRLCENFPLIHHLETAPLFCVQDWASGETLRHYIKSPEFSERKNIWIMTRLLNAVETLHGEGVVHRDIKPSNIIVNSMVKLIDFGLAKRVAKDDDLTVVEYALGSEKYSAWEQLEDARAVDCSADLPSLARIFCYIFSGGMEPETDDDEWQPHWLPTQSMRNFFAWANDDDPLDRIPDISTMRAEFGKLFHLDLGCQGQSPESEYTILDAYDYLQFDLGGNRTRLQYWTGLNHNQLKRLHATALDRRLKNVYMG